MSTIPYDVAHLLAGGMVLVSFIPPASRWATS